MNEKIKKMGIALFIVMLNLVFITGCTTIHRNPKADIIEIGNAGNRAIGQLISIDRDIERIQSRFGAELDIITGTTTDLGRTIRELIEFAYGLLDAIDDLRGEVTETRKNFENLMDYLNSLDTD